MKNLLENGQKHWIGPPFSARRILVCANDRPIDDGSGLINLELKLAEDRRPVALPGPVRESVEDAFPRSEPLGQVAPRQAGLGPKKHRFDEEAVAPRGLRAANLSRQDRQ